MNKQNAGSLSVFTLIIVALLGLASCSPRTADSAPGTAATVIWLEGRVTADGSALEIGDEVKDGALIVTDSGSLVELSFGDYRVLRAGADSRLILDSRTHELKLDTGSLSVVQAQARRFSRDKAWELRTPTTVAAVRGTVYFARVDNPDETYFCLCNGAIHLEDPDHQSTLELEASHHDAVLFTRRDGKVVYSDAGMLYHTDAEVESLADSVNVPIDWSRVGK